MPHFLAITLFRQADFARAGIRACRSSAACRHPKIQAIAWSILLVPISLMPTVIGLTGWLYGYRRARCWCSASLASPAPASGPRPATDVRWARGFFFASLLYLPALIAALVADVLL
jgi:protoheme IX farnesyltransferase